MTNARCLTEGVDIPAIDCVLFADPKQSVVDIVQAAGRALRRSEGKECGYILLPLIVPSGMDLDTFAETTAFRQVARTITALSTQDERIAEEFRAVEQGRKSTGRIVEIEGDVPVGLKLTLEGFAGAVWTRVWERVGRANWRSFEEARDFARSLLLPSGAEWTRYSLSGALPPDIPASPEHVYVRSGWRGMGDWLGTGDISPRLRQYRAFEDARAFARGLGLADQRQNGRITPGQSLSRRTFLLTLIRHIMVKAGRVMATGLERNRRTLASCLFRTFDEARSFARAAWTQVRF